MTLLQLKYFVTLSRVLHYTRAAQELNISQPSLSYAMNELELELGAKLFRRENRKVELTVYGERFLPFVKQALATIEEGSETVRRLSSVEPETVRLGYVPSLASSLVPTIINDLYGQSGGEQITFRFTEDGSHEVLQELKSGALDLCISMVREEWTDSVPILYQRMYLAVAAGHPLASREAVSVEDFIREPQILLDRQSSLRAMLDEEFARCDAVPRIAFEVRECNTALQYAALGLGVTVVPYVPALDDERLSAVPIFQNGHELGRTVYLSKLRGRPLSLAAEKVADFIEAHYRLRSKD